MGFPSRVRHGVDSDPSVKLRNLSDGVETASAVETAVSLNVNDTAIWANGAIPFQTAAVVINVQSIDTTTGDEAYAIQVQVDSDQAFAGSDFTVVGEVDVKANGVYVINLDGPTIKSLRTNAKFIRLALVAGGTTPSINYEAWLAPSVGNAS
jgi:hypothetical protein